VTEGTKLKLHTMLGNYPNTKALKSGEIKSDLVDFDFVEVKVANTLFKKVVRDAAYDFAELAIVTYLQARAYGKPYVLLPATIVGRGQHHTAAGRRRLTGLGAAAVAATEETQVLGFIGDLVDARQARTDMKVDMAQIISWNGRLLVS